MTNLFGEEKLTTIIYLFDLQIFSYLFVFFICILCFVIYLLLPVCCGFLEVVLGFLTQEAASEVVWIVFLEVLSVKAAHCGFLWKLL